METAHQTIEQLTDEFSRHFYFTWLVKTKVILILKELLPILEQEYTGDSVNEELLNISIVGKLAKHFPPVSEGRSEGLYFAANQTIKDRIRELRHYKPSIQAAVLAEVEQRHIQHVGRIERIQLRLPEFQALLKGLDAKAKLLLIAVRELAFLDGINLGCFAKAQDELVFSKADDVLNTARKSLLKQPDSRLLCELYEAANEIHNDG